MTSDFRTNNGRGVVVVISGQALDEIIRSPTGYLCTNMMYRMEILQTAAKRQIRLGHIHGGGGYGNLRDSIVKRLQTQKSSGLPLGIVGSSHPIALIHHEGTKAHIILPVKARALRFPGPTASGFVFAKVVHHPGTRPNRYLTDNIPLAMAG